MSLLILSLLLGAGPAPPPVDTLVFCPADFSAALAPWVEYRQGQGHRIKVLHDVASKEAMRGEIRRRAARGGLRFVLLVGDAHSASNPRNITPTHLAQAKVNLAWGSEPRLATDNWFVDLDDDIAPDLAIGRLTADSSAELRTMVQKIMAYEAATSGAWQRRVNFIAGVGGFGSLADAMIESTAKKFITAGVPSSYRTTMTYASWRSPYCPDPRGFRQTAIARMNEGCLFWVYMGHGQRRYLDLVRTPGAAYPIFDVRDVPRVRTAAGAPVAVFLACYTGAFDEPRDCLAEELLKSGTGPIAVLAGSRVTMPYGMAVLGSALLDEHFQTQHSRDNNFQDRQPVLGELLMHAKRRLVQNEQPSADNAQRAGQGLSQRAWLDAIAKAISPAPEQLTAERAEHAQLFNLFGDPLLRLPRPRTLTVRAAKKTRASEQLVASIENATAGRCTIEVVCRRDRLTFRPTPRPRFVNDDQHLSAFDDTYNRANDQRWTIETFQTTAGSFQRTLDIPSEARGHAHIRVMIESDAGLALGVSDIYIRPARPSK